MNLDDLDLFDRLDPYRWIDQINALPDHLSESYLEGLNLPLPGWTDITQVILVGVGEAALAADLLANYAQTDCALPVLVLRDYRLPAWAQGPHTLFIALSGSGDEEEAFASFSQAVERGCPALAITTGGKLAKAAAKAGSGVWILEREASFGRIFGLLLALFARMNLLPDPAVELQEAVEQITAQQAAFRPQSPVVKNPAKRMAGQLVGRSVMIFAADWLVPAARYWKNQINLRAKTLAQFEPLPEADYNTLLGLNHPETLLSQVITLFLTAPSNHPRNLIRLDYTRQMYMAQGVNTDFIQAQGASRLAQAFTLLNYGDYVGYYLAMAYQENPANVENLVIFQEAMSSAAKE